MTDNGVNVAARAVNSPILYCFSKNILKIFLQAMTYFCPVKLIFETASAIISHCIQIVQHRFKTVVIVIKSLKPIMNNNNTAVDG